MNVKNLFYKPSKEFSIAESKAFAREDLIYNVTEDLLIILEDREISKTELSKKLGKSKSFVSQILNGSRNMTLGTLSDICFVLGFSPKISLPVEKDPLFKVSNQEANWRIVSKKSEANSETKGSLTHRRVIDCSKLPQWQKTAA